MPIMTKNYNVSIIGIANQLRASFKKCGDLYKVPTRDSFVTLNYYQVFIIARIIEMQIFKSFPSLKLIYDYFKDIIKFHSLLNIPVIWITPIGIKISQLINISTQNKVSIRFGKKTNTVVF